MDHNEAATAQLRDALCRAGLSFTQAQEVKACAYDFRGGHPYLYGICCRDGGGHERQIHRIEGAEEFDKLLSLGDFLASLVDAIRWVTKRGCEARPC